MTKKIVLLSTIYLVILASSLSSCEKCGPFPDKFKLTDLSWTTTQASFTSSDGLILTDIVGDSVSYLSFGINIIPERENFFSVIEPITEPFSLIQTANACDPGVPTTDETIDSIKIITSANFDASHPAGSDIMKLFDVVVTDQTKNINSQKMALHEYIASKPTTPEQMVFMLTSPPDSTGLFAFTVKYYQDGIDHDYFEFTTDSLIIKK